MKQSVLSMQKIVIRTMYIHRFYPSGECNAESFFVCRYILNLKKTDKKVFYGN